MDNKVASSHISIIAAWMGVVVMWVGGVAAHTVSSGNKLKLEAPLTRGNHTLSLDTISEDINPALVGDSSGSPVHNATAQGNRETFLGDSAFIGSENSDEGSEYRTSDDVQLNMNENGVQNTDSAISHNVSDDLERNGTVTRTKDIVSINNDMKSDLRLGDRVKYRDIKNKQMNNENIDIKNSLNSTNSALGYVTMLNNTSCLNKKSNQSNATESIPPCAIYDDDVTSTFEDGNASVNGTSSGKSLGKYSSNKDSIDGKSSDAILGDWSECTHLQPSFLVEAGFRRAVSRRDRRCARFWCEQVLGSEARHHEGGVYHVVQMDYIAEEDHDCLLNITKMVVLHHSWPMCSSDFVCATNHTTFAMSASDCMPVQCRSAETAVFVFMVASSVTIVVMSIVIMAVIILCPQFHKPKYYLRFSLAATDFLIGIMVCGHAAYNQWVGLSEVPRERFHYYANLKDGQLFRHVPNCLWGVSDVLTQISGFFVTSGMIISLYTLSLMSLDRYLLLTRTHYRSLVTARRVSAAIVTSWCCGLAVPSLHFIYRPQKQHDICVNYDTSSLDVHIINNESKIATADYKVYLMHAVPLGVTLVIIGLPVLTLLVFSCRTLRKYNSYTRDHSVRQVKSALQLTQNSLSRQPSATSLANMVTLSVAGTPSPAHYHLSKIRAHSHSSSPAYKLKFTSKKKTSEGNDRGERGFSPATATSSLMESLGTHAYGPEVDMDRTSKNCRDSLLRRHSRQSSSHDAATTLTHESEVDPGTGSAEGGESDGGSVVALSPFRASVLDVFGLRRLLALHHTHTDHVTATIRRLRGRGGEERLSVRERDREITCTVLVNIVVFMFACFPLLAVGAWMMFLYFTHQDTINNKAPLKQMLFVAPWLMALNSLWNAVLHLTYNHKFRSAACRLIATTWRKLFSVCRRRARYQA